MRRVGLVGGVLVLVAGFAAAWVMLRPPEAQRPSHGELPKVAAAQDTPDALFMPQEAPAPLVAGHETINQQEPEAQDPREPRDPGVDATRADPADRQEPGAATDAEPKPEAAAAKPKPDAAPAQAEPIKFIRGHDRPRGQNLGNTRPGARRLAAAKGVQPPDKLTDELRQDRRGLYAQYYHLASGIMLNLDTSKPAYSRIDRQVHFPDTESFSGLPVDTERFAAIWEGFLVIDTPGEYWLFWGASKGGRVELAGETVLLQDGMVRYVEVSTVLTLEAGAYPLRIEFAQFENSAADWRKAAASFMWVPDGERKPVPVPPEMLLVPQWMWTDLAPIITSLSRTEGEIGDEITIHGKNLGKPFDNGDGSVDLYPKVSFAGQPAKVLSSSDNALHVRVPIGAQTGDVIVWGKRGSSAREFPSLTTGWQSRDIPSNSLSFEVTTQFGLLASWHNLYHEVAPHFVEPDTREPDLERVENPPSFGIGMPQPIDQGTRFVRWEGALGLPDSKYIEIEFKAGGFPLRVTLDGDSRDSAQTQQFGYQFETGNRYLPLVIEAACGESHSAMQITIIMRHQIAEVMIEGNTTPVLWKQSLPTWYLFPPFQPAGPPAIKNVAPVWADGETPPVMAYDADASRPAIRVGQEFTFTLLDYGQTMGVPGERTDIAIAIDGVAIPYTVEESSEVQNSRIQTCRAVMPDGVGEGRMVATQALVNSEPVMLDIANRGLIAYLYDMPQASGLTEIPDLGPLYCFRVRKDRTINFETAADFDLPFPAETFVIEWYGGLIITEEADYIFTGRTDDGMRLWLNDQLIIDANRPQAPRENASEPIRLLPGVYRFRMQYFENNQHEVCVLQWGATRDDTEVIPPQVIPARAFSLDVHPALPNKTSSGKRADGS